MIKEPVIISHPHYLSVTVWLETHSFSGVKENRALCRPVETVVRPHADRQLETMALRREEGALVGLVFLYLCPSLRGSQQPDQEEWRCFLVM